MPTTRQARYVVQKAPHVGGAPIPEDEPCIVIRGQDVLALAMMDYYLDTYCNHPDADPTVLVELASHRDAIEAWQEQHPPKWADR